MKKYDQILLNGLRFFSHVGVFAEEKQQGQMYELSVILFCDRLSATCSDAIADTIDYSLVYAAIRETVEFARFDLIERLAGCVCDRILQDFSTVRAVEIEVRKPQAPIQGDFDYMGVRIRRARDEQ